MLFATNGTQSKGGSYVTVTVSGRRRGKAEIAAGQGGDAGGAEGGAQGPQPGPAQLTMALDADESLGILLLPGPLEGFEREDHARSLLSIPRVLALEASRRRPPAWLRNAAPMRQARRLRLPGRLRVVVLYHPAQYPLARALCGQHDEAELWYLPPDRAEVSGRNAEETQELLVADSLARDRSTQHAHRDAGRRLLRRSAPPPAARARRDQRARLHPRGAVRARPPALRGRALGR